MLSCYRVVCRPGLSSASSARAMHTNTIASPTSRCRWKRGRPVASSSSAFSPHRDSGTSALPATVPAAGANVRLGLWNPTHALRFATDVTAVTYHTEHKELGTDRGQLSIDAVHDAVGRLDAVPSASLHQQGEKSDEPNVGLHPTDNSTCQGSPALDDVGIAEQAESPGNVSASASLDESEDETEEDTPEEIEPLSYQIPEGKLSAAMSAAPNTRASYWSTRLYQGPEGEALSIHYCKSKDVAERVAKKFLAEKVVGFDIEWKPFGSASSIKQNASLIQLACEDRIALFHISLFDGTTIEDLLPPSLKLVLESPDIYKVGVAIKGDFSRLAKYLGIQAQGVFELSRLHNLVQWHEVDPKQVNNRLVNLAAQVHQHLQLPLHKGEPLNDDPATTSSVRESDWSLPLDMSQIHYAAADAYAGFRLYDTLERKRALLKPTPPAVLVCDYDNAPKPKPPRKTTKKSVTSKGASGVTTTTKTTAEVAKVNQEDEKDSDEYETASEEFANSQELKDSEPNISLQLGDVTEGSDVIFARRVGRIELPKLRSPDPAYPILPRDFTPESNTFFRMSETDGRNILEGNSVSETDDMNIYRAVMSNHCESDEFADAELEEALQGLTLDNDGRLKESEAKVHMGGQRLEHQSYQMTPLVADAPQSTSAGFEDDGLLHDTARRPQSTDNPGKAQVESKTNEADVKSSPQPQTCATTPKQPTESTEFVIATDWARDYLQATIPSPRATTPSRIRATIPHLRAYHMWHYQQLAVVKIAEHLREPPLSLSTVQGYILQAITMERLDYDKDSLKVVVLAMPVSQRKGRWKWLAEKLGAL